MTALEELSGFRMPAEWTEHEATWLAWPHDPRTWVAGVEKAEDAYVDMVEALAPGERVELLVPDGPTAAEVDRRLAEEGLEVLRWDPDRGSVPASGIVRLHAAPYADSWVRDTGPTVLVNDAGARCAVDWTFDAWGGKYEELERDDALARLIADRAGLPRVRVDTVLEGGAIEVDGDGTALTTEACLLNPNRGPDRTRDRMEALLEGTLGVETVLWLGDGLTGDDTDGHVDTIARFTAPGAVVLATAPGPEHPDHRALEANRERLEAARDAQGRGLDLHELPMPEPVSWEGSPLPASYANFYVGNGAVLAPAFGVPQDDPAHAHLAERFPDREVVPIDSRPLVVGFGSCHCLTQQVPAAP